jgi:hypothetical protein
VGDPENQGSGSLARVPVQVQNLEQWFNQLGARPELWAQIQEAYQQVAYLAKSVPVNATVTEMRIALELLRAKIALAGGSDALRMGDARLVEGRLAWLNTAYCGLWHLSEIRNDRGDEVSEMLWCVDALREQIIERSGFLLALAQNHSLVSEKSQAIQLQADVMRLVGLVDAEKVVSSNNTLAGAPDADQVPNQSKHVLEVALAEAMSLAGRLDLLRGSGNTADIGLPLAQEEEPDPDDESQFALEDLRTQFYDSLQSALSFGVNELRNALARSEAEALHDLVVGLRDTDDLLDLADTEALEKLVTAAQKIHRSRQTSDLNYDVFRRLDEVSRMIDEALTVRARDAQMCVYELLDDILEKCPVHPTDRQRITESLDIIPCLTRAWGDSATRNAQELIQVARNGTVLFQGLMNQCTRVAQASHLSAEAKEHAKSWLCRLAENETALLAPDPQAALDFVCVTDHVVEGLIKQDTLGERLVGQIQAAAHEQACTDWASTLLVDLSAVIASEQLERRLAQLQSRATTPAERQSLAHNFVRTHVTSLKALLHFSAFKAFSTDLASAAVQNKEGVEQGLYLYTRLQKEFCLPGQAVKNRMDYADLAENIFGKECLAETLDQARAALQNASRHDVAHQSLLMDNLECFGVNIWSELKALLPRAYSGDRTSDGLDFSVEQCDHSLGTIQEKQANLDWHNADDIAQLEILNKQYQLWAARKERALQSVEPLLEALVPLLKVLSAS